MRTHGELAGPEDALYGDAGLPETEDGKHELCRVGKGDMVQCEAVQLVVAREVRVERHVQVLLRRRDGRRDRQDDKRCHQSCNARAISPSWAVHSEKAPSSVESRRTLG